METIKNRRNAVTDASKVLVVVFAFGGILSAAVWLKSSSTPTKESSYVTSNVNSRLILKRAKPVILKGNLPVTARDLESLGDKLAEASLRLREQQKDLALKKLIDAEREAENEVSDSSEHQEFLENITVDIKHAESDLEHNRFVEAKQEIRLMLNRLDRPEN